jgi:hypothetical protein
MSDTYGDRVLTEVRAQLPGFSPEGVHFIVRAVLAVRDDELASVRAELADHRIAYAEKREELNQQRAKFDQLYRQEAHKRAVLDDELAAARGERDEARAELAANNTALQECAARIEQAAKAHATTLQLNHVKVTALEAELARVRSELASLRDATIMLPPDWVVQIEHLNLDNHPTPDQAVIDMLISWEPKETDRG